MTKSKLKFGNSTRCIRLKKANQKPEKGIEIESKLLSTGYKNVFRRVVRKELDLKKYIFSKVNFLSIT